MRRMHGSAASIVVLTMAANFAVGCASYSSNLTGPSAAGGTEKFAPDQAAGTWRLTAIQPVGQGEQPVPGGASYELALAETRVSTKADCNTCSGNLTVNGQTLTVGPSLACTRAACPTMAFENAYIAILTGDSAAVVDGDSLKLSSPRGVLRFRR